MTFVSEHNQTKRNNFIKKLLSNARAIISNQIALPLGVSKMHSILYQIALIKPLEEIDLQIFSDYKLKASDLAIGTERLAYHPDFLKRQDKILDELTLQHKDEIIDKCFEIINKFADK